MATLELPTDDPDPDRPLANPYRHTVSGLTTHSYLWTPGGSNALFYCPAGEADFATLDSLGGVDDQYLSHQDEAGPMLAWIAERFGTRLHAPAAERETIEGHSKVDVPLSARHIDDRGVEVIPTPGHSPGSTSYLVEGAQGRYLVTGDTMFVAADGRWSTFVIPSIGDRRGHGRQPAAVGGVAAGCRHLQRLRGACGHRPR